MMLEVKAETQCFSITILDHALLFDGKSTNHPNFLHSLQPVSYSSALFLKLPLPLILAKFLPLIFLYVIIF